MHAGASSLDAVMSGIEDLKADQQALYAILAERVSQTRQASKINEADLEQMMTSLKCLVTWAEGDPSPEDLLGPKPEEDTAAWR